MKRINTDLFDIETYLQTRYIYFDPQGKNIQQGNLGINCLWCDDPSNHLGIRYDNKIINCWRCGTSGTIFKLIMKIDKCNFNIACKTIEEFSRWRKDLSVQEKPKYEPDGGQEGRIIAPIGLNFNFENNSSYPHLNYLKKRGFTPDIINTYKLGWFGPTNQYKLRLYIPIYRSNQLVSFTTRDVTNEAFIPYIHCSKHRSVIHPKETIYNIDKAEDTAIVVEGVTDVWAIGHGTVGIFGVVFTHKQIMMLSNFKRIFVLFDAEVEAQKQGKKLAHNLSAFVPEVEILSLSEGDPADLNKQDIKSLRKMIFGKIF